MPRWLEGVVSCVFVVVFTKVRTFDPSLPWYYFLKFDTCFLSGVRVFHFAIIIIFVSWFRFSFFQFSFSFFSSFFRWVWCLLLIFFDFFCVDVWSNFVYVFVGLFWLWFSKEAGMFFLSACCICVVNFACCLFPVFEMIFRWVWCIFFPSTTYTKTYNSY